TAAQSEASPSRDLVYAAELFRRACVGGKVDGCVALGGADARGEGIVHDAAAAMKLWVRACDAEPRACAALARAYEQGLSAPRDPDRASALSLRSGDAGSASGCAGLAGMLSSTNDKIDSARATELYDHACSLGEMIACVRMGERANPVRAAELFAKA